MATTHIQELRVHAQCDQAANPPLTRDLAEQIIRELARLDYEERTIEANAAALVRELDRTRDHILSLHGDRLREWVAAQLTGKRRSVRTLHGVAGFRTVPARLQVIDHEAALEWARTHHPDAVTQRLDPGALGSPADYERTDPETGELAYHAPPGLTVVPARETFSVRSGLRRDTPSDDE